MTVKRSPYSLPVLPPPPGVCPEPSYPQIPNGADHQREEPPAWADPAVAFMPSASSSTSHAPDPATTAGLASRLQLPRLHRSPNRPAMAALDGGTPASAGAADGGEAGGGDGAAAMNGSSSSSAPREAEAQSIWSAYQEVYTEEGEQELMRIVDAARSAAGVTATPSHPSVSQPSAPQPSVSQSPVKPTRKETHKEVERRRRDAITKGINDLAELITPRIDSTNKSDILSAAIDYVCSLQRAKAQLEDDLARAREQAQEGVHVELLAELAQARREAKEAHEARRRAETMILEWRADDEGERERKRVRCAYHEKDG